MNRRLIKTLGAQGLHATGADRLIDALNGRGRMPLVICYHRVVEDVRQHPWSAPAMLVTLRTLEAQLDWIGGRYRFVGLDELATSIAGGGHRGRPLAAVTFDDGYADVYRNAFPLLQRKGIPAAMFITTDLVGTDRLHVHDQFYVLVQRTCARLGAAGLAARLRQLGVPRTALRPFLHGRGRPARRLIELVERLLGTLPRREAARLIRALEQEAEISAEARAELRTMSWPMLRGLHAAGFTIGSHTRRHYVLPNETAEEVREELAGSKRTLERRLGAQVSHLAYPDGQYCPVCIEEAAAAGYRCAYTTCFHGSDERPLLAIPRRTFWERTSAGLDGRFSAAVAACQVHGVFDPLNRCRKNHGPGTRAGVSATAVGHRLEAVS